MLLKENLSLQVYFLTQNINNVMKINQNLGTRTLTCITSNLCLRKHSKNYIFQKICSGC